MKINWLSFLVCVAVWVPIGLMMSRGVDIPYFFVFLAGVLFATVWSLLWGFVK